MYYCFSLQCEESIFYGSWIFYSWYLFNFVCQMHSYKWVESCISDYIYSVVYSFNGFLKKKGLCAMLPWPFFMDKFILVGRASMFIPVEDIILPKILARYVNSFQCISLLTYWNGGIIMCGTVVSELLFF